MTGPASPLGGTRPPRRERSIPSERLVAAWRELHGVDVSRFFVGVPSVELWRCPDTDLAFFWPPRPGDARFYDELSRVEGYYRRHRWEHDRALEDLAGVRDVLEVGCGDGTFLDRLRATRGIVGVGIEPNPSARARAAARGLDVRADELAALAAGAARFDAVLAFQVLEHVEDPLGFLTHLVALTRPGGRLLLGVPNAASFLRFGENLLDHPPHHLTRWSPASFAALGARLPLAVERLVPEPLSPAHVDWYLRAQLSRVPRRFRLRSLARRLSPIGRALLRPEPARALVRGHTLYVCFRRGPAA